MVVCVHYDLYIGFLELPLCPLALHFDVVFIFFQTDAACVLQQIHASCAHQQLIIIYVHLNFITGLH